MNLPRNFWEKVYRDNAAKIKGICYRYVSDISIAEDLMQDTFITAINKCSSYTGKGKINAWLNRIAINTALMYLRNANAKKVDAELLHKELYNMEYDNTEPTNSRQLIESSDFSVDENISSPKFNNLSSTYNLHSYYQLPIAKNTFINIKLGYQYLEKNNDFMAYRFSYHGITSDIDENNNYAFNTVDINQVVGYNALCNFHQINMPIQIIYRFKFIQPYLGINFGYRIAGKFIEPTINRVNRDLYGINENPSKTHMDAIIGIGFKLSKQFTLAIDYKQGLNKDLEAITYTYSPVVHHITGFNKVYWKSNSLNISLQYSLKRQEKQD